MRSTERAIGLALSPEAEVVFLAAAGPSGDAELARRLAGDINYSRLLTVAGAHKATATLSRAIARLGGCGVPPEFIQQMQRETMIADFHAMHLRQKLLSSVRLLNERGISVILLKGAAMGVSYYRSFVERPMADIDLMLHPRDAVAARNALLEREWIVGDSPARDEFYEQHHHLAPLRDAAGSGHTIELHLRAFPPPNPFGDVAAEMWREATALSGELSGAFVPSPKHMLLYACVHFAWSHKMCSGAWRTIRDVAELSDPTLEWDAVIETAKRWRADSSCYWTLRMANSISGVAIPAHVLESMKPRIFSPVADMLERHLIASAIPGERPQCPSQRATDILWRAAIQPRRSGHVQGDPAEHERAWFAGQNDSASAKKMRRRIPWRARAWLQYLRSVLSPSLNSLRSSH